MGKLKQWAMDCVTEPDNKTVCPVRLMAIWAVIQYMALGTAHYVQHGIFDAQAFALGLSALLGSAGIALGIKKDSPVSASPTN